MISPLVSVLIPVYNSEKYLRSFLETVVLQTLEDIEIIAINNQSTDKSLEILNEFRNKYPEKVFVYTCQEHYEYVGAGRNLALQYARGEYVYFCDSDDLLNYQALEKMYKTAKEHNSDIVCAYAVEMTETNDYQLSARPMLVKQDKNAQIEEAILSAEGFWVRLIRRSLLEKVGKIPENVTFDDIAYLPVLQSYASRIRFISFPVYYYYKRVSSTVGTPTYRVVKGSIDAEAYALAHCNQQYRDAVMKVVADRINGNLLIRWQFTDILIQHLKGYWEEMSENTRIQHNANLYKRLKRFAELPDSTIPNTVYLNGFGGAPEEEFVAMVKEKAFNEGCSICVLDENCCPIVKGSIMDEALRKGLTDFVGQYFAIKMIYETGGIFLDHRIQVINSFNFLKNSTAFFAFLDNKTYSDWVFGGQAGNGAMKRILDTYEWSGYNSSFMTLSERIKMILTVLYDIPLDGKSRLYQPEISVLGPDLCVVDTRFNSTSKQVVCEHDFSNHAYDSEYVTLKRSTLELLLSTPRGTAAETAKAKEWDKLTRSHVYKFVLLWKKVGDSKLGPLLKGIFQKLLWLRQKIRTALRK